MNRICTLLLCLLGLSATDLRAQVGIGTTSPSTSAVLDLNAANKGLLIPRMNQQTRTAMGTSLPDGLMVYQTDGAKGLYIFNGSAWVAYAPLPNVGTPGTYGSEDTVPVITTDAQGRVTNVASATIRPATPACPASPTGLGTLHTIELNNSRLCVYDDAFAAAWNAGALYCVNIYGGQMCSYLQLRTACLKGMTLTASRWMADRIADDQVIYTNSTDCSNFDGPASSISGSQSGTYCCVEYPKY